MADQYLLISPINPHFFQPLLPGFRTHLNIPVAFFSKHVEGRNDHNKNAKLRTDASDKTWLVKMDGLKFTDGWEDFAFAHDLRLGDIVVFRHEGGLVFHVAALGPSCCQIQYTSSHNINDDQTNIASGNSSRVKKNPRRKVKSSSDHSRFVANVTAWSLSNDRLYIPHSFARLNGLNKMCGKKIFLHNEEGRSWKLNLKHDKSGKHTYAKLGWTRFCAANGMSQGHYTFKLVRKSEPPIIRLCRAESRPKQISESKSSSHHSCFEGSVIPSSLNRDQLYLPRSFVSSNGLDKGCSEIVLKNEQGRRWTLVLKHFKTPKLTFLKKGWTSFCQVNRIKVGDSFKFKLVGTEKKPVLCLCPVESNRDKTPVEYSEGSDDIKSLSSSPISGDDSNKSEESEEESIEDKNISQECLEIKKTKYWSRCRDSVENMDDDQTNIVTGNSSREKRLKKNPRKKVDSSSDHFSFVANVSASSLSNDRLYVPMSFARSNGLDKMSGKEIVLLNEEGRSWKLKLKFNKAGMHTYVKPGWTRFCAANGMSQGQQYTLKLVRKSEPPVIRLCLTEHRPKSESESKSICSSCRASSSYRQNRFVTLTFTLFAFQTYKLFLPRGFTHVNGINKPGKITLLGQDGVKQVVHLFQDKGSRRMRFGKGWREFCKAQDVKIDESFVLELIWEKEASPVLKFCTKVNSA